MADQSAVARSLKSVGFKFLKAQENFETLSQLLSNSERPAQIGIFSVDWEAFLAHPGTQPVTALLSPLQTVESHAAEVLPSSLSQQLKGLTVETREAEILSYLRRTLAKLMQVPLDHIQPGDHLLEMGTDSLMVMDAIALIQKELDLMIYPREIYEHPHLNGLATYLSHEFQRIHCRRKLSHPMLV